jgi:hypothetical protein
MNKQRIIDAFSKHSPITPMSLEESKTFLDILLSKDENINCDVNKIDKESEIYKILEPLINSFQAQVFLKRLKLFTSLHITTGALVILMYHFPNPAVCVMYAFYLHNNLPADTLIDVKKFAEIFPWGFFSVDQLNTIWNELKVRKTDKLDECHCYGAPDKLLDYIEPWEYTDPILN